jgi:Domain of unknown function (DUF222)
MISARSVDSPLWIGFSLICSKSVSGGWDDELMTGDNHDDSSTARDAVADARREAAAAMARLAEAAVRYADCRIADDTAAGIGSGKRHRTKPGEFVADELALLLRDQPYQLRCLLARTRRLTADLPTVWEAFQRGEVDLEQIRVIDRVARRVTETATLAAIDNQAVEAAQTRTPKQLQIWLLRLLVQLEPLAFAERHRRALADRRVTVVQGVDGIGYVTGEVTAADAAAIDAMLAATARNLGADDPRTEQQRRADLFADLLLGRIAFDQADTEQDDDDDEEDEDASTQTGANEDAAEQPTANESEWLEIENIDPDTGELLGGQLQRINSDGEPVGEPVDSTPHQISDRRHKLIKQPRTTRIGVVVPLASLLGASDTPAELADRSGFMPAEALKQQIAETLDPDSRNQVLFTRLLTDNGGRLLDITELGRYPSKRLAEAIKIRAGTCRYPNCTVPADRCDLDHHQPVPQGPTSGTNMDPFCRRHHRGKTFAWHTAIRDHDALDWTMPTADHYRCVDQPLPTGRAA